ncbi:TPA: hypothetical protein I6Y62_004319 [Vibrio parahaemolyticus]|nr:hypothetical protein [Vibrio parahaemolyticus]HAS3062104.1 hypothetical protein [Vibrio parahaemolyticus]
MESGVSVELNFAQAIRTATAIIEATPEQLNKATTRAIKKTLRWAGSVVARELGQSLGVAQKGLKPRIVVTTVGSGADQVHILWVGVLPLAAEKAGKPRQTRRGVSVRGRRFDSAFVADIYNGEPNVWVRAAKNREHNHTTLSRRRKAATSSPDPKLRGRFPVQRVGIAVEDPAIEIFNRLQRRVEERFKTVLNQELNYAVNHEKR